MPALKFLPWAGWPIAAMLFFFWLDGRENLAMETERCNTDKMTAVAEASEVARLAVVRASTAREKQLEAMAESERRARHIAEDARVAAESRPARVVEVIKRVAITDACINTAVPADLLDSLRND